MHLIKLHFKMIFVLLLLVVERPETNLDQKYQAPINEVTSIINDPSSMSQSIVGQNVSVGRHDDLLQHQPSQNSINGDIYIKICNLYYLLF